MLQACQLDEISRDRISFSIVTRKYDLNLDQKDDGTTFLNDAGNSVSHWLFNLPLRAPWSQHQFEYMLELLN